jgi:hypothetical protein
MPSIIRSVSLNPKTAAVASKLGNFSAFVRECLMRYEAARGGGDHTNPEDSRLGGLCNAMHHLGPCVKCYPLGGPDGQDWRAYANAQRNEEHDTAFDAEWLLERCAEKARIQGDRWEFITESVAYRPPEPETPQVGIARQWFRKWF